MLEWPSSLEMTVTGVPACSSSKAKLCLLSAVAVFGQVRVAIATSR